MNARVKVIDDRERDVVSLWRKGRLSSGTIVNYLHWVRRFRKYCEKRKLIETEHLTASGVKQFIRAYDGPKLKGRRSSQNRLRPGPQRTSRNGLAHWVLWARQCRCGERNKRQHYHRH